MELISLYKDKTNENIEKYKIIRKEAKKVVKDIKHRCYENLYKKLGIRDGEKGFYKLAKVRDKKSRDLNEIKCIKDKNVRVLVQDNEIRLRWKTYFDNLFNDNKNNNNNSYIGLNDQSISLQGQYIREIRIDEVKEAIKKMKSR